MLQRNVSIDIQKHTYNLMYEYAAGRTLHDLIHKSKPRLGESEAAYFTFQIFARFLIFIVQVVEMITGRKCYSWDVKNSELEVANNQSEIPSNISDDAKDFLGMCTEKYNHLIYTTDTLLNPLTIKNYTSRN
ncbi:hypothetical protein CQW23_00926 [Capsicum baccatum]|uniref:Uncharacterized protein n=1 Tax=Capsicum baccatum TaxID=33114 RepID=A0A2G2XM45_CAPBA|nr:hypothetical protein CQW23_00926 [Capsicum baccatum]